MSELLLELFSEEIPANMQLKAVDAFCDIFTQYFQNQNINFDSINVYVTPRRLTIHVKNLPKNIESKITEIKGPKTAAPSQAIDGFCQSNKIDKSDLKTQEIKGISYYVFEQKNDEQTIIELLKNDLASLISSYTWPKSMYWGAHKIKWVRPLQNILCILDDEIINFEYGHLTANNQTYGHRFMSHGALTINNFNDYQTKLEQNFVILDQGIRKKYIEENLNKLALSQNLNLKDDEGLLNEVTGLVEYPQILMGKIDQKFTSLPSEVLITSMKIHQKYFSAINEDGSFAPYFFFVANIASTDTKTVIRGNEKVLSARLSDALYFYEQDKKNTLLSQVEKLDKVIFHAKLGSLKDKVLRLAKIAELTDLSNIELKQAALLCKSDIISEMVREFPNLQGIMGAYYAKEEGLSDDIALAIENHYKPLNANQLFPINISIIAPLLAIIDKIDSLCGLMLAGERASGSKDPYALRRYALNIIKIVDDNVNIHQILDDYVDNTLKAYGKKFSNIAETKELVINFIKERLVFYYQNIYEQRIILAVTSSEQKLNLLEIKTKIKALTKFLNTDDGFILEEIYKRINNLITSKNLISTQINDKLFDKREEEDLYQTINNINSSITIGNKNNYEDILVKIKDLKQPLANFFSEVMVMHDDEAIKNNRLILLNKAKQIFDNIADFSKL